MIFAIMNNGDFLSYVVRILFTLPAVYIALVFHEVAHGLVAKWNGDPTAKNMGRLSFNPMKHFDLVGFVMMMLVGFGYAKPVPVNPNNFKHYRRGLVTVALAGIIMNILIAFVSALLCCLMMFAANNMPTEAGYLAFMYLSLFFSLLTQINLSFAFFNLLPIYPLDGFRLVESFTHYGNKYCSFMRTNGQYILWGLVGLSFIITTAYSYVSLPFWFQYIDVLGTYLNFFVGNVQWAFNAFWGLMIPGVA